MLRPPASAEPLLHASAPPPPRAPVLWACINLFATSVGAGILSVPICFSYCGTGLALGLLALACAMSAASLRYIAGAAARTGASSYLALGERCYGEAGAAIVLWSLGALLLGALVMLTIIVIDVAEMIIGKAMPGASPSRAAIAAAVAVVSTPLCLPSELLQLRFASMLSVVAILFTCAVIVSLVSLVS